MSPTLPQVLWALPWMLLVGFTPVLLLRRMRLSKFRPVPEDEAPLVSIIVPARDEAANISICLASLFNTAYPNYEIIVVDDGSVDGTGEIVRILAERADGGVQLVEGKPLPDGWLGKPWACWQGAQRAKGELLLFTDADTRHEEMLLSRAVGALRERRADLLSVLPRQLMVGFWERLVLPQIFTLLTMRYYDLERINHTRNARDVIANGQFILVRRDAYDAVGGHEVLRDVVVEDQRLAQLIVRSGRRLFLAYAEDLLETRMYRSLAAIVEGWSKNLALGSREAAPAALRPAVPWLAAAFLLGIWVLPPVLLLLSVITPIGGPIPGWSLAVTALSLVFWLLIHNWMRVPVLFTFAYPVAAAIAAGLFVRSALRGDRIAWKGREYRLGASA